jgi:hypothetical protein
MIRPLRQRHRRMVTVLGVVLPVVLVAGIAARKPAPIVTTLPSALATATQHLETVEWERTDLFTKTLIQVRLLRESAGSGRFAVGFSAAKDFVKPDLLVYWAAGNPDITTTLPDKARLLGAFNSSAALTLPAEAALGSGVLVLYSLADQEIVEVSKAFGPQKH